VLNVCATLDAEAAVLRDPNTTGGIGQFALIQSAAPAVGMEVSALNLGEATEIERAIVAFGGSVVKSCKVILCRRGGCSWSQEAWVRRCYLFKDRSSTNGTGITNIPPAPSRGSRCA